MRVPAGGREVSWWIAVGIFACGVVCGDVPADAFTVGGSPGVVCALEVHSNEIVEKATKLLDPADGAQVLAGTPVAFSGESGAASPLSFNIASSPTLLATPDIDSGSGTAQGETALYTFLSSKASATPRTIYWDATYTRALHGCEGPPVTYTTPPWTLKVLPSDAEEAAARRQAEAGEKTVLTGGATPVWTKNGVRVALTCPGPAICRGTANVTVKMWARSHHRRAADYEVARGKFSIEASKTVWVELRPTPKASALLRRSHTQTNATFIIAQSAPVSSYVKAKRTIAITKGRR